MSYIADIHARQILDSRGNPTVEVDVVTENGIIRAVLLYPAALLPENTKQLNCAMAIKKYT